MNNFDFTFLPITEGHTCMRCGGDKENIEIIIGEKNRSTTLYLCKTCRSDLAIKLIRSL